MTRLAAKKRGRSWNDAFNDSETVKGVIFGRVKGGFTVDLSGAVAFLPGSQVDIRPVRDITPLMGTPQPIPDPENGPARGNIVVSRRAVLEESRAEARSELIASLAEGQVLTVSSRTSPITVRSLIWAVLTASCMSPTSHGAASTIRPKPCSIGQTVTVQVIRFNPETQRISLGMKQLQADPWEGVDAKYPWTSQFMGRVTNITDYGAFVELEPGVEGLVHVSEMSWTKKNVHPGKIVATSQEVEVRVLDVDRDQAPHQPGHQADAAITLGTVFVDKPSCRQRARRRSHATSPSSACSSACPAISTAWSHLSDSGLGQYWRRSHHGFERGQMVKAKVLDVDPEKERISLGIKQLQEDPFDAALQTGGEAIRRGATITGTVTKVTDGGLRTAA